MAECLSAFLLKKAFTHETVLNKLVVRSIVEILKNIEREKFNIIQRLSVARTAYLSIKHFAKQLVHAL